MFVIMYIMHILDEHIYLLIEYNYGTQYSSSDEMNKYKKYYVVCKDLSVQIHNLILNISNNNRM